MNAWVVFCARRGAYFAGAGRWDSSANNSFRFDEIAAQDFARRHDIGVAIQTGETLQQRVGTPEAATLEQRLSANHLRRTLLHEFSAAPLRRMSDAELVRWHQEQHAIRVDALTALNKSAARR
jgi:hypothetical protein